MKPPITLLVLAALVSSACPGSSLSVPDDGGSPGSTPTEVILGSECPNEAAVVTPPFDEVHSRTESETAEAVILVDDDAVHPCGAFLVVGWNGRWSSINVSADITPGFGFPNLLGITDVNGDAGPEVLVQVQAGASTQFASLFTIHRGVVAEVSIAGGSPFGDLIAFGGSVGHLDGAACDAGQVVLSSAVPQGDRYLVQRRYYDLVGDRLENVGAEAVKLPLERLEELPDLSGQPFSNCT